MKYRINMLWDNEAGVWVATSEDIPGLVLESGSHAQLCERIPAAVSDLVGETVPSHELLFCDDLVAFFQHSTNA